ncbi:MAG: metallophosphoesterase family protein [Thermodesulfobacteriota bacterium]|nr:metallophosphoesterase family protein [Thermodesulfobacteriota bacterium]
MGKIFAVGDIHGCFDKLKHLMDRVPINYDEDTLVFLGDYIDRGNDSYKVVDYLIDLKKKHNDIVFLKGNHETMLFRYLSGEDEATFLYNGGEQTLKNYFNENGRIVIPPAHIDFYRSLQPYYETDDYIFVHAGMRANIPIHKQSESDLLWIRRPFIDSDYDFGKRVIFGHTPFPQALIHDNKIGIDTGAVYGYKLTCIELPAMVFHEA